MQLKHENLIKCYRIYELPRELFLVLEFADGGTLSNYLKQQNKFAEYANATRRAAMRWKLTAMQLDGEVRASGTRR
jgi:hypothetical protein